jgi:lysophospholipase L1-like esterase
VAAELGSSVADNMGQQEGGDPSSVIETSEDGLHRRVVIDPTLYDGISIHIEDPEHRGLRHLWQSLRKTALGVDSHITRIGHYGDSSIATDLITHTVRRALQGRFGDAGHGFILPARGYMPYGHRDIVHRASSTWQVREAIRGADADGYYGYGGVQVRGVPGAWAIYATDPDAPVGQRVSRFQVFHQRYVRGGKLRISIDGDEERIIETRAEVTSDEVLTYDVPDGHHQFKVRSGGGGQPRLYGVVLEREGPGVVYDSMGMVGARAQRMLNIEASHLGRQLGFRGLDLLILGFGGNEADDRVAPRPYQETFQRVIRHFRQSRPEMSCLVFAPLDQGMRARGGIRTMPSVPIIVEAQRAAALAEGCAFYNNFEAMGGLGAMGRWNRSRPRLGLGDLRHATPAGYEILGNLFFKALMAEFARYLEPEATSEAAPDAESPPPAAAADEGSP